MYNIYTIRYSLKKNITVLNVWQFIAQHIYKLSSSYHTWNRRLLCRISTLNREMEFIIYRILSCSFRATWIKVLWGFTLTPLILKCLKNRAILQEGVDGRSQWLFMEQWDDLASSAERRRVVHQRNGLKQLKTKTLGERDLLAPRLDLRDNCNNFKG